VSSETLVAIYNTAFTAPKSTARIVCNLYLIKMSRILCYFEMQLYPTEFMSSSCYLSVDVSLHQILTALTIFYETWYKPYPIFGHQNFIFNPLKSNGNYIYQLL
jgi:hypothetical protein